MAPQTLNLVKPPRLTKLYASVAAANGQTNQQSSSNDLAQSIQIILQKIIIMEGSIRAMNEKVNKLESRNRFHAYRLQQ